MTRRTALALVAISVLAGLALLFDRMTGDENGGRTGDREALFSVLPEEVTRIELENATTTVDLMRTAKAWTIEPGNHVGDAAGIASLLETLTAIDRRELRGRRASRHASLDLDDANPRRLVIHLWTGDGEPAAVLLVGKTIDQRKSFVRLADEDLVYAAHGALSGLLRTGVKAWRDRSIFRLEPKAIERLELISEMGTIAIVRQDEPSGWRRDGEESTVLDTETVDSIAGLLAKLAADDFSDERSPSVTGLDSPLARSVVTLANGEVHELLWGFETKGAHYAKRPSEDDIYLLSGWKRGHVFRSVEELQTGAKPTAVDASPAAN